MRVEVVTLFPELFAPFVRLSFVGRAVERGILQVTFVSPREFGLGKHKSVDDTPYGGGSGMVMRVDCLVAAMESLDGQAAARSEPAARRVLMTPQGDRLGQRTLLRLAEEPALMLVCGRYEGFDERVRAHVHEELSLGDFVLTGGEVAAMAVIEGVVRLLPGVLGNEASVEEESHNPAHDGLLEYPQYTRPADFRGEKVPDILLGGHHAEIARWRRTEAIAKTRARRPDIALPPEPISKKKSSKKRAE